MDKAAVVRLVRLLGFLLRRRGAAIRIEAQPMGYAAAAGLEWRHSVKLGLKIPFEKSRRRQADVNLQLRPDPMV